MKAIDRIYKYIEYKSISIAEFERLTSISNGYLSKMKRRSAGVGEDILNSIIEKCPDVSPEWLLTGNGKMLRNEERPVIEIKRLHNPPYREKISDAEVPLYNIDAAANLRTLFDNRQQNIIDTIRIPDLPNCDGAIYIRGDSMYPLLKAGDIIIYKEIFDFANPVYGEIYLIDYGINGDDYLVVKYVKRSDIKDFIHLVSYNAHHDPIDIPVAAIRAMAIIKASVRLNTMV